MGSNFDNQQSYSIESIALAKIMWVGTGKMLEAREL